jgi:hypothetical protein
MGRWEVRKSGSPVVRKSGVLEWLLVGNGPSAADVYKLFIRKDL